MISAFQIKRTELIQSRLSTHLNPLNKDLPIISRQQIYDDPINDSSSESSSNREESKSASDTNSATSLDNETKVKNYFYVDNYCDE